MSRLTKPIFGDKATGTLADLISYSGAGGQATARPAGRQPGPRSATQKANQERYARAHATWLLLPRLPIDIDKRRYLRRTPTWPVYLRAWILNHPL